MLKRIIQPLLILLLSVGLIVAVFTDVKCKRSEPVKADTVTTVKVVVKHDTLFRTKTVQKYTPFETIDCVYMDVDTAAILADYNRVKIYKRLLWSDSLADIELSDTVFHNTLQGARIKAKFYTHDTTRIVHQFITVPEVKSAKLYLGFQAGYIRPDKMILGPVATLCTKHETLYSLGFDPFNKAVFINLSWKLSFHPKVPD